ncbi:MAG: T9SS type A sorting domain-containing protein [Flavobacteriia bacterium]|nr:T9SS type A sorting domain-containing protein [Flavobacteriia bacterium]
MKNATPWKWLGIFALLLSPLFNPQAVAQCSWEIDLLDSYGDGWNGNTIDVRIGATTTNYTLANGYSQTISLPATVGDTIELTYNNTGLYNSEVSFVLKDATGNTMYASPQGPSAGLAYDTIAFCPPCPKVAGMTLTTATSSSLDLSWNGTGAASYTVIYGSCGFNPATSGLTMTASTTSASLTSLNSGTCYDIYSIGDCSAAGDGVSDTAGPFTFYTAASTVSTLPYTEDFESNDGGYLPTGANASWQWGVPAGNTIDTANSGTNAWVTNLTGSYNNNEVSYLTTPIFDLTSYPYGAEFSFYQRRDSETNYDGMTLEISTNSGTTWTKVLDNGTATNWYNNAGDVWWDGNNGAWTQSTFLFDSIGGMSGVQFRFKFDSDFTVTYEGFGVDDISLTELPCSLPYNFAVSNLGSTSVDLSWTSAAGYSNVEWGESGFVQGTGTKVFGATGTATATGLNPGTVYDVYIQDSCGASSLGTWVGPFKFTTLQDTIVTLPYYESFEASHAGWVQGGSNSTWEWGSPNGGVIISSSAGLKAWVTNLDGDHNASEVSYTRTPVFDLSSYTSDIEVSFVMAREFATSGDGGYLEVTYDGTTWNRITDNGTGINWYNDASNQWWNGVDSNWTNTSIIMDSISGKNYVQFRFGITSNTFTQNEGMGIDGFNVEELSCTVPTNDSVANITSTSADVYFTSSAVAANFEYGVTGFTPGSGTLMNNVTSPVLLTGLTPGTTYQYYIQDSCGVGNSGNWIGPFSFTTLQATVSTFPYMEDFESSNGGWISYGAASSWQWGAPANSIIASAGQGVNAWVTNLTGAYNNNELSYLQTVIFDASSTVNDLEYTFSMIFETENNYDEGWVEYSFDGVNWTKLVDNGSATGWYNDLSNQWWENTDGTTWMTRTNIIPGSAGQSFVQIRHVMSSDFTITREGFGIDDVMLDELICSVPSALGATNVGTTTADIYWNSSAMYWNIEWGPSGFVPGTGQGTLITNATNDTLTLSNLTPNTCYDFYVQDSCANGNSQWIGPFVFCTDPTCIAPMNLGTNNVDSSNATLVWDGNNVPGTYLVEFGSPGFALGTGTMLTSAADSITLSGLSNASDYCYYVAEICTPGDTSAWSGPYCFTTLCGTVQGDDIASAIPVTGSGQWNGNATCYTNALSNRTGVEVVYAYTPSPGTTFADFETCGSGYDTYLFLLDASQATLNSSDDDCGLQSQLLGEAVIPGNTYYVVIEAYSNFTTPGSYVLTITETNPCPAPSNLTTTAVNCTSLDLIWNNGGSSYAYELEYGTSGFNPGTGTMVVSNDTTETVSGLTTGTSYDFYVRGFCTSDTSAWAGPFTISTSNVNTASAIGTYAITNVTLTDAIVDFDGTASTADSISWDYDDGSAIEWGTAPQHTYTQNGTYNVVITAYTDCGSDDDTIQVVISTISLTEAGAANFSVYPNPSYGDVTVSFEGAAGSEATINLMNLQGQILETIQVDLQSGTRDIQMDLSNLPKGVYMIRYNEENAVAIRRVVLK